MALGYLQVAEAASEEAAWMVVVAEQAFVRFIIHIQAEARKHKPAVQVGAGSAACRCWITRHLCPWSHGHASYMAIGHTASQGTQGTPVPDPDVYH